ncbi:MAG TPA: c-type cytochrome [Terriglobales bacterium]|nr:c-type cytochrome [Terriglobales bacterium]
MSNFLSKIRSGIAQVTSDVAVLFGVVSVLLLISLAIAPTKDYFSEWRHYQKQFLRLASKREDADAIRKRFRGGIHQTWLPALGVVDRCETCHLSLSGADLQVEPFRKHPPIPHAMDEFGCVVCHRGQGPATTVAEAHYTTLAWEQPILPARYLESSCGQCHLGSLPGTPQLNSGRKLLASYGCVRCHRVMQPDGTRLQATDDPPDLRRIAEKTSREWIYAWIKDPQAYAASATMPNFQLSDADARDVASFLIAQSTGPGVTPSLAPAAASASDANAQQAGASLYGESFCASCHAVQNAAGNLVGGDFGPELTRIGSKVKPEWLAHWLEDPPAYDPATRMPHYRFDSRQVALLTGFLMNKSDSDLLSHVNLPPATAQDVAHGKKLVAEYGCAACHQINGVKTPENFAPELTVVGSKPLVQIVFTPVMKKTLPDYIAAKIRDPRAFGTALKMPKFALSAMQVDALTTALLAQTERARTLPVPLRLAAQHGSDYQPAGKAGQLMHDLRCQSCHTINGNGGDIAPDLSFEGSAVQRAWFDGFMKNPTTLRPALIRRMPRFNLNDSEIKSLGDYILTAYQKPGLEPDAPVGVSSPDLVAKGKQLYYSKYGCQSCHIVDYKTDKGYIGPPLTQVGLRLTPAWIYAWLKAPQSLIPGAMEPDQHMSDEDARALTAYLTSLKTQNTPGGKK